MKYWQAKLIVGIILIVWVEGECYEYQKGDTLPTLNGTYCGNIIKWPVSDEVIDDYVSRDSQALANYTSLYQDYYIQGSVDIDCLGMAKYFFCAKAYPTCTQDIHSVDSICNWMCQLFSVRCGEDNKFYQGICVPSAVSSAYCSFQKHNLLYFSVLLILMLFLV